MVEKLTILLSSAVVAVLLLVLGLGRLFLPVDSGSLWLGSACGRHTRSGYHVGCVCVADAARKSSKPLIVNPLTRFLTI